MECFSERLSWSIHDSAFVRTHRGKITCYMNKTVLTLLVPKGTVSEMSKDTGGGVQRLERGQGEGRGKGGGVVPHDPAQDLLLSAAHGG